MGKGVGSDLFVNDGSFMEKFKQLQQKKQENAEAEKPKSSTRAGSSVVVKPTILANRRPLDMKMKTNPPLSGGKLAFMLKQKSKIIAVAPVKFAADEEEEEEDVEAGSNDNPAKRQKFSLEDDSNPSSHEGDVAPSTPSDPAVRKVADKLASFVAKNGRQFEHITRQRNPGDTPFKFLFDSSCPDYKYYEYRLLEEEKALVRSKDSQASQAANASASTAGTSSGSQRSNSQQHSNYQTPASALYGTYEEPASAGRTSTNGDSNGPPGADPVAMMEYYMTKAAREEQKRQPKQSKDEMPPPASLQAPGKKGHHMGDYIPPEELEKFMASCNDAAAQRAAREAAEKAKIQADNIGHKLLSKMGWKEGEGLGSDKSGRAYPVLAGNVKLDNLGVGAHQPGDVTADDDIYEQYKKRMMLGYRYRPNPLNNPRKAYY